MACDVAVVGAGPYGLAAAAHLRGVRGLDVHVLGRPMSFWEEQMPAGMLLRSPREASHLADPAGELSLDRYEQALGVEAVRPVPLERFVAYGRWFQEQAVPALDRRRVLLVERAGGRFRLELVDGGVVRAARVVLAVGIAPYAWRPPEFSGLPPELVSHASDHRDLRAFRGRRVVVVGGGQSALESAALLHEAGTDVRVLVRAPRVNWLVRSSRLHRLGTLRRLLYAPADVGPAGLSWLVATPAGFGRLPRRVQDPLARRSIRPAASSWLAPRLEQVPIHVGRAVVAATASSGRVRLLLDDGGRLAADHVLLGTGYRVDVARCGLLAPELLRGLRLVDGYPLLDRALQSSVAGLHFLGAPTAYSFGPLLRFVAGTGFAARALARGIR
ncbi:MAG TPA: FAD-dependent oxidoreductase [Gaiellaceae bacterium]|nr:FAD-dependent oxidoreductase [Gaiellaceae bacterium]